MLDPDTGNVRSTNYSERRYASQDEASAAGKAAVVAFLGNSDPNAVEPARDGKPSKS